MKVQGYLVNGTIHVHKAGCADIKKSRLPQRSDSDGTPEYIDSELQLIESWYDCMIDERPEFDGYTRDPVKRQAVIGSFIGEFHVYPCVTFPGEHK